MPHLAPFRGLRYQPVVGSITDVLVPPYDALTDDLAAQLRERSRWNLIHVEAPEPASGPAERAYAQAGDRFRSWIADGVLDWDREPGFYIYRHRFDHAGTRLTRLGLIGLLQLHEWAEHVVCPHERTQPHVVADRFALLAACRANLSLGIALVKDPHQRLLTMLNAAPYAEAPTTICAPDGAEHEFGRVTDPDWCRAIQERLRYARLYVADGHHRYEAALAYRRTSGALGSDYIMTHVVSAHDAGLTILPSHRIVHGVVPPDPTRLAGVEVSPLPADAPDDPRAWDLHGHIWLVRRDGVVRVRPTEDGGDVIRLNATAQALIDTAQSDRAPCQITTTPDAELAVGLVATGHAAAAILAPPALPDVVTWVADQRRLLPPKSTYFWPKPLAGLVIRTLDGPEVYGRP